MNSFYRKHLFFYEKFENKGSQPEIKYTKFPKIRPTIVKQ